MLFFQRWEILRPFGSKPTFFQRIRKFGRTVGIFGSKRTEVECGNSAERQSSYSYSQPLVYPYKLFPVSSGLLESILNLPSFLLPSCYLLPTFFLPSSYPPFCIYQKNKSITNYSLLVLRVLPNFCARTLFACYRRDARIRLRIIWEFAIPTAEKKLCEAKATQEFQPLKKTSVSTHNILSHSDNASCKLAV